MQISGKAVKILYKCGHSADIRQGEEKVTSIAPLLISKYATVIVFVCPRRYTGE